MEVAPRQCRHLYLIPILLFLFVPCGFTITYIIAVYHEHVHPVLPMISETGERVPENFLFAIVVNVGAFFGVINYTCRYLVLSRWSHHKPAMPLERRQRFSSTNRASLLIGFFAVLGAIIVANVEADRSLYLHNMGAMLVVVMQLSYSWMHTYLTHASPMFRWTCHLRLALSIAMTVAFICGLTFMPLSRYVTPIDKELNHTVLLHAQWVLAAPSRKCNDGTMPVYIGYQYVCRSDDYFLALLIYHIMEWFIVFCGGIFLLSFAAEYRQVTVQIPYVFFMRVPTHKRPEGQNFEPEPYQDGGIIISDVGIDKTAEQADSDDDSLEFMTPAPSVHHSRQPSADSTYIKALQKQRV